MGKATLLLIVMLLSLASAAMAQEALLSLPGVVIIKIGQGTFASGVEIQKDGKILVSASSFLDDQGQSILLRRNADGSPDRIFGRAGMITTGLPGFYVHSEGMALQEDGKVILAGRAIPLNNKNRKSRSNDDFLIIRYSPDGQMDKGFNGSGWVNMDVGGDIDIAYGLALQKDRKIVVIGNTLKSCMVASDCYHFALLRYNENGTLDKGFGKHGTVITRVGSAREDSARAVAIQSDNKIIVVGGADDYPRYGRVMALVRYRADGRIDPHFGIKGKVMKQIGKDEKRNSSIANAVAIQPDGKIIVGVNVYTHGSYWIEGRLVRLNNDGSLDHTFGNAGSVTVNRHGYSIEAVGGVTLQSDGKILFAGGAHDEAKSSYAIVVGRSNGDGSPDTSFGSNGITQVLMGKSLAAGRKIVIQSNERIIVAGDAGMVDPNAISHRSHRYPSDLVLFRLNTNGRVDKHFGSVD